MEEQLPIYFPYHLENYSIMSTDFDDLLELMKKGNILIDKALVLEDESNQEDLWEELYFKIFSPSYAGRIEDCFYVLRNYRPEGSFREAILTYWKTFGHIMQTVRIIPTHINLPF